jgi:hypothetical protein
LGGGDDARRRTRQNHPRHRRRTHATAPAEQALEQVGQVRPIAAFKAAIVAKAALAAAKTTATAAKSAAERHRRVAVGVDLATVELGALVLVGKQVIGPRHLGKAFGRLGIVLVVIGVQFLGELAIGRFHVLFARTARHTENGIRVCCHGTLARDARPQGSLSMLPRDRAP